MYQSGLKFSELSETAKEQAKKTYADYEEGEYTVIGDVIIMRHHTIKLYEDE